VTVYGEITWRTLSASQKEAVIAELSDGDRSAGQIAERLGISRNAVIGVVFRSNGRIRLSNRKSAVGRRRRRRQAARQRLVRRPKPTPPVDPAIVAEVEQNPAWRPLPDSTPVTLLERTGCKWPVSVDGAVLFCNCAIGKGENYCATHAALYNRSPRT
jgi:hypothetical protein